MSKTCWSTNIDPHETKFVTQKRRVILCLIQYIVGPQTSTAWCRLDLTAMVIAKAFVIHNIANKAPCLEIHTVLLISFRLPYSKSIFNNILSTQNQIKVDNRKYFFVRQPQRQIMTTLIFRLNILIGPTEQIWFTFGIIWTIFSGYMVKSYILPSRASALLYPALLNSHMGSVSVVKLSGKR